MKSGETRTVKVYSCLHIIENRELIFSIVYDITDEVLLERKNKVFLIYIFLLISILILNYYLREIKKNKEIQSFNELRDSFIDSYDNLIYLKDENLKYVFVNKAVEKFYNMEESQIIGYGDFDITDKELAGKIHETDIAVLEKGTVMKSEINYNGNICETIKFPVKMTNGNYGVGAYVDDITTRKEQISKIEYMSTHDAY